MTLDATHLLASAEPFAAVVLALAVLVTTARLFGELALRFGQPEVLGELVAGMLLASIPGTTFVREISQTPTIAAIGQLGAIVLLFDAGLALEARDVMRVGFASFRVALIGTVATFVFGYVAAMLFLPSSSMPAKAFVAAALTATSIGISARVFKDMGQARSVEARTVLSAAVIDDVLGLIVLSLVSGLFADPSSGAGAVSLTALVLLVGKTIAFLGGSLVVGRALAPRLFHLAARIKGHNALVVIGLAFCFLMSWGADAIGLAPIIGAFTAGLLLEQNDWREFVDRGERGLDQDLEPISALLVPVFFVLVGMKADLRALGSVAALLLALGLTAAAILGKLASGLGAPSGTSRLAVSFGMMPRGEVSLIFASLGLTLGGVHPVLDARGYSALIIMVALTTLLTPFGLRASLAAKVRGKDVTPKVGAP